MGKASPGLIAPGMISTLRSLAHVLRDALDSRNQAVTTAETRVQELDI
jgi:hypothetical protein